ncbi:MAG TPA: hypothetical protein DDY70_02925 [Clostridiales bacterium]|nr:hypothetical protein [Clostridiales bacterium]
MKEAIFLTARPIDPKLCAEALAGSVSDVNGTRTCVFFGKAQKSLYIWFPSALREEENENFIYKDISGVPSSLPFGTHLEYHRCRELKDTRYIMAKRTNKKEPFRIVGTALF